MQCHPPSESAPGDPRHAPRSRRSTASVLAFQLLGVGLLAAACGGGDSAEEFPSDGADGDSLSAPATGVPSSSDSIPGTEVTTVPPPSGPTPPGDAEGAASAIPASTLLTPDGWGPLRIGMTRGEVIAAAGDDANPEAVGGPDPASCDEFRPRRAPQGLLVMIENGRLTRISLGSGSRVETDRGIGVGNGADEVRRIYGDRARSTPHKYVAAPAEYLTVWTVEPPAANARGLVYEVGPEGRISRIHAGGPSIQYVEGCL